MCTLAFAWHVFDDAPVVVAANRDELLGRPASGPAVRGEDPRVLMPRDEEAGGTWIGVNEHGVFVGITNRRADVEGERSRGLLVTDLLTYDTASAALSAVERELARRDYAGFNLVVADAEEAALLEWDGVLRTHSFNPGIHVVVNAGFDDGTEKSRHIREALRRDVPDTPDAWVEQTKDVLRDHDLDACLHENGYGTRSSSLVTLHADGSVDYQFADGPPCETSYRPVDGQF